MIQGAKKTVFRTAGRLGECSISDTIVVAGNPRSGTTWMLDLLRTLPGYKAMMEPLWQETDKERYGFSSWTYLEPQEEADTQKEYLEDVLSGRIGTSPAWHFEKSTRLAQLLEHATKDRLVVKFIHLNRMMHWFCNQFDVRGLVFIIRHPCAVVASTLKAGGWSDKPFRAVYNHLEPEQLPPSVYEHFSPIIEEVETRTEALAVLWCLNHYVPIYHNSECSYPWIIVPYERLVTHKGKELNRIGDAMGFCVNDEMRRNIHKSSSSIYSNPHDEDYKQLSKWRSRLSDRQINEILKIVDKFGIDDIYTDSLEPNYDLINKKQKQKFEW